MLKDHEGHMMLEDHWGHVMLKDHYGHVMLEDHEGHVMLKDHQTCQDYDVKYSGLMGKCTNRMVDSENIMHGSYF